MRYFVLWLRGFHWSREKAKATDWIMVGLTLLVALAAIGSAWIFQCQLEESQKATAAIRKQTEVAERPWLSVDVAIAGDLIWPQSQQPAINLKVSMTNVGKSVAKNIEVEGGIVPSNINMMFDPRTADKQAERCNRMKFVPFARIDLFPTQQPFEQQVSISATSADVTASAATVSGISGQFVGLTVVGCVVYHTSFDMERRFTYFAFRLLGPGISTKDGKPATLPDGMPMMFGFEVGKTVPKSSLQKSADLFARNDAD